LYAILCGRWSIQILSLSREQLHCQSSIKSVKYLHSLNHCAFVASPGWLIWGGGGMPVQWDLLTFSSRAGREQQQERCPWSGRLCAANRIDIGGGELYLGGWSWSWPVLSGSSHRHYINFYKLEKLYIC